MKQIAKEKRQQRTNLEDQLKQLEKCLDKDSNLSKYNAIKNELDTIYDHIIEANATGINVAKIQQNSFRIYKKQEELKTQ